MAATEKTTTETLSTPPPGGPSRGVLTAAARCLRSRRAHPMAAHDQLTHPGRPNHAHLGRGTAAADCSG